MGEPQRAERTQMIEKPVPWWRKALNYALSGIRSGFGLFPKPAKPDSREASSLEKDTSLNSPEPSLEPEPNLKADLEVIEPLEANEPLTHRKTNPEAASSVEEIAVEPVPAAVAEIAAAPDPPPAPPDETRAADENVAQSALVPKTKPLLEEEPEHLDIVRESTLEVAPVSRPAVLAASTPPAAIQIADEPVVGQEPIAETTQPIAEDAVLEEKALVAEEVIVAEPNSAPAPDQIDDASAPFDEESALPQEHPEPAPEPPAPADPIELCEELPAEPEVDAKEEPLPTLQAEQDNAVEEPSKEPEIPAVPVPLAEPEPSPESIRESGEPIVEPTAPLETTPDQPADPAPISEINPPNPDPAQTPSAPHPPAQPASDPIADQKAAAKLLARQKKLDDAAEQSPFSVIVGQVYTGPLDLLLDLIRQQDIDIYDIPIAKITSQFLAYVNQLKASDVDVAGEFIYTASLLIHIKSKMLLPRSPAGPDDTPEDPRRELVERLLEHERFKNAAQMLQQKQMLEAATWTNPGFREFQDDEGAEPEIAADTVDLVRIFRDILERARNRPVIDVEEDSVTVGQMIQFLARRLTLEDKPIALRRLLSHTRSERALVAMFLALLELVRLQAVLLRQDRAFSDIFIKKHSGFDAVMNQGLANALDDWR
jgi:segregation and condensation protein A